MTDYTTADYEMLLRRLEENRDEKYRVFNESLIPGTEGTYGVRAPVLRALSKELLRGDWRGYLALAQEPRGAAAPGPGDCRGPV